MHIILSNTNWSGHQALWTSSGSNTSNYNLTYSSGRYMMANHAGYGGQRYHIEVMIPIKAGATSGNYGASGTVKSNAQVANDIASSVLMH